MARSSIPVITTKRAGKRLADGYNKNFGQPCEDCGERDGARRTRCKDCNQLVCSYCFNHKHGLSGGLPVRF